MRGGRFRTAAAAAMLVLAGCGGGGGSGGNNGGGGGGGTANRPPSFTSPSAISLVETVGQQESRVIVQLTATDPDGNALSFQIVPGKDAARFIFLGQEGALAFDQPVSFETARDGNGDNIYEVDVRVSDGTLSSTQAVRVTVTNSTEGLVVRQLAGLPVPITNGRIAYLDDRNELLVVAEQHIFLLDAETGAEISQAPMFSTLSTDLVDIAADDLGFRGGHFFALLKDGGSFYLLYVSAQDGAFSVLWGGTVPGGVDASLGFRGNDVLIAFSDGNNPAAAQDPDDFRGNIVRMASSGNPADRSSYSVTPQTIGWGLRSPRLSIASNIQGWPIDRGENFNEISQADSRLGQGDANFEWPIRDGTVERTFTGTIFGTRVAPRITQEIGVNGAGRWLDAADSLQGTGWFGVWVISDDQGNIWTWDAVNDGPLEKRNLDFGRTNVGPGNAIVSMDDGDADVGNARPIYMIDVGGLIYVADLQ